MKKITYEVGKPLENVGLVSIVVPVYNVSKFLERSLNSILQQTYPYWEAILVNDGSTDNSLEILRQYAARDSRFKVINKQNGGLSSARNAGMEHISGKYTVFFDSDDMLYPQFLEIMLKALLQSKADMVWCKSKSCSEDDGLEFCKTYDKYEFFEQPDPFTWYFESKTPRISLPVWGRIYYTEKLLDLRYVTQFKSMCEDFYFSLQYFSKCMKIICVRNYLLAYRQNCNSLMHQQFSYNRVDDHILIAKLSQLNFSDCKCKKALDKRFAEIILEYCCAKPYFLGLDNYMDFWEKYSVECQKLIKEGVFYPKTLSLWKRWLAYCFMKQKWDLLRKSLHINYCPIK